MSDLQPYCASLRCSGMRVKGVLKQNVKHKTVNCPDCGSALFWKPEKKSFCRYATNSRHKDREMFQLGILRKGI